MSVEFIDRERAANKHSEHSKHLNNFRCEIMCKRHPDRKNTCPPEQWMERMFREDGKCETYLSTGRRDHKMKPETKTGGAK